MSISWRYLVRALCTTLMCIGASFTASAQDASIPETIAYTGFLRDQAGDPVSGPVNLTFELYEAPAGGSALWTETQNGVTVTGGVFSVALGSASSFASQDLVFDRPLFLAIAVNGESMDSRLPLTSSPYALRSGQGISNVLVSCPAESIQSAIDQAPAGGRLIITIEGVCEENVHVERDRVTFAGANPPASAVVDGGTPEDGIRGIADNSAALLVDGASDISIRDLVLENAPGTSRYALQVIDNGSTDTDNVLLRNSYAGGRGAMGGFLFARNTRAEGNSNYGFMFTDGAHGWIEDSKVIHNVSATSAGDEGAVAAFRQNNIHFRGDNQIINAGADGSYDASDPAHPNNSDNGPSIYVFHGVQVRQDGGHTLFVGPVAAGNQVQVSLRDPELVGNIDLSGNSLMDLRTSSTGAAELSARTVTVSSGSKLTFGRNNMELTVSGQADPNDNNVVKAVSVSNHSTMGLYRDSITATFGGRVTVDNFSEVQVRGDVTVDGDVRVSNNSEFNSWRQTNSVSLKALSVNQQSRANLRGAVNVDGSITAYSRSAVDVSDASNQSITDKTVLSVTGDVEINDVSSLTIGNTAVVNVTGRVNLYNRGDLSVDGFYQDPPGCDDEPPAQPCTVDNASALIVAGAAGVTLGQYASASLRNGAVLNAKAMDVGPFVTLNINDGSDLEIEENLSTAGPITMYSHNQVFWNGGSVVVGNIEAGALSIINIDGTGNELEGSMDIRPGPIPGFLNVLNGATLTVFDGSIDCQGQPLANVEPGSTVTFDGGGSLNCGGI